MPTLVRAAIVLLLSTFAAEADLPRRDGNRLTYLDSADPFYVGLHHPKLVTPQWFGETNVDAVITLGIDDMGANEDAYENYLRPILNRLKEVEGRAPVSIFCNALTPDAGRLQKWLKEGLSLEVHTLHHPCPILGTGGFEAARNTFHGGVDLLNHVSGNKPVAFRTPCCDSINSPSPRLFAEIFNRTNSAGQFLTIDSSVMNIMTASDPALPREWTMDADGREKFRKYVPFPSFVTTIENYPYPYVIGNRCWEFAPTAPSDWEGQNLHKANNPQTVADWKTALDCIVKKQGVFNLVFHPHNWIRPDQVIELIDHAALMKGRVQFLTFREAQERLDKNLLVGHPLRRVDGQDNGVRIVDLNNDGFMDVVIANEVTRVTRVWEPGGKRWMETGFPAAILKRGADGLVRQSGIQFGIVQTNGFASIIIRNEDLSGAWHFDGARWVAEEDFFKGLELKGSPVLTSRAGRDTGVRLRDLDRDGICEIVVGGAEGSAVFSRPSGQRSWYLQEFSFPADTSIVNANGEDNGLRFVDLNGDGYDDVLFSNEERFSVHLFVPVPQLGWGVGWTRQTLSGKRGSQGEIPPLVRTGDFRNNGAWFHSRHLWVQNENTAHLPDLVERRSFDQLLNGHAPLPLSPEAALKTFALPPDFTIELVASEPLVRDPIAFEWGADGKLWVVEMGDYPRGDEKIRGAIRYLEDTDADGRYDKATEFLNGLHFPSGVMPWRKGVIVSAAPEIFYAEDTDGDGKADLRKILFSGFVEGNQQHRVNGFSYGLDGWLYGANGDSGGEITSARTEQKVNINNRDFRIQPDLGLLETEPGQTQFGRHRDDWGNWFGNNNATWLWHYFLPDRYLARNPQVSAATTRQMLANYPDATRVFARSREMPRPNQVGAPNHVTSANSAMPYRDTLFGPGFDRSVFISEPVHNVVHREVLQANGITFTSQRAPEEQGTEFLSSTDNYFRPAMLKTGPDGALYLADMYRLVIEHPEYMPKDMIEKSDFRAGQKEGRIYRVLPKGVKLSGVPNLTALSTAELVSALNSPNGWQRDTAQRLILERGDPSAARHLRAHLTDTHNPLARLHALYTLTGLNALGAEDVIVGLNDTDARVQEHAVRLSEPFLQNKNGKVLDTLIALVPSESLRVGYQLAFTLGESKEPRAGKALSQLALRHGKEEHLRTAILSSSLPHLPTMLAGLLSASNPPPELMQQLVAMAGASDDKTIRLTVLRALTAVEATASFDPAKFRALTSFLEGLQDRTNEAGRLTPEMTKRLAAISHVARGHLAQTNLTSEAAERTIAVIGYLALQRNPEDVKSISSFLQPRFSPPLQQAALTALRQQTSPAAAEALIDAWPTAAPAMRSGILAALMSRTEWTRALPRAIDSGKIQAAQLSAADRQALLKHSDQEVREKSGKLFVANLDRQEVIKRYQSALTTKGDAEKGRILFRENCATCHRLGDEGNAVGPDLAMVAGKPHDWLLSAILDPNQMVDGSFVAYSVTTKDERELLGIVSEETPAGITMKTASGSSETILRANIVQMTASGLSLMPEGIEGAISPSQMADLIAFLNSNGPPRKRFANNEPVVVQIEAATKDFRLTPKDAEIYGSSIVLEPGYGNLGWWNSEDDLATWSIQLKEGGLFDVWLDWALAGSGAQNRFIIEATQGASLSAAIPGTGSWDNYKHAKFGTLDLPAGVHRLTIRSLAPLQGSLMDLRELRLVPKGTSSQFASPSPVLATGRKQVPGNNPRTVKQERAGKIVLSAADCEIYGDKIAVYEPQRCLGWWTSEKDHVIWTFEVAEAGNYEALLEWSITDEWANNRFVIECGENRLEGTVPSTGGFEYFRVQEFGAIKLAAGVNKLMMRPTGPVKGELADLRGVTLVPKK